VLRGMNEMHPRAEIFSDWVGTEARYEIEGARQSETD
jgi:hypothetical protein